MLTNRHGATGFDGQAVAAQNQKRERFGSSLERLKWDEANKRAIEKERKPRADGEAAALKLSTLLVVLNVLVSDSTGEPVSGLTRNDFAVVEDGQREEIAVFSRNDQDTMPRKIILIVDRSGSERAYLESSLKAARMLVDNLRATDQMAVVTDDVEIAASYTGDKARLNTTLDRLGGPGTARGDGSRTAVFHSRSLQFSALFAALRELVRDDGSRHIIIFQTDGDEAPTLRDQPDAGDYVWNMPRRNYGLGDIYAAAQRSNAMIYTIIPSERLIGLSSAELLDHGRVMLERMERARFSSERDYVNYVKAHPMSDAKIRLFTGRFAGGQDAAQRVAELTGGWDRYLERPEQAASIYQDILSDMNQRYVIGYYPADSQDSGQPARLRRLKVTVKAHPEYVIRGRDSYLAPN